MAITAHHRDEGMKAVGYCRCWTGMPVKSMGSSWIEDSLPSKDWNVPPSCKLPDCHEDHHCDCSRNIIYQRDRLDSRKGEDLLRANIIL